MKTAAVLALLFAISLTGYAARCDKRLVHLKFAIPNTELCR
jgi:hypothetical protein